MKTNTPAPLAVILNAVKDLVSKSSKATRFFHPHSRGIRMTRKRWIAASGFAFLAMTISIPPAFAAEPYIYAPEDCEFTATFPEKPQKTRKCDTDRPDSCYDSISFARVFDLKTSVNVRLTCNPITENVADQYTQGIMKGTLDVMARRDQVGAYEIRFREGETYKQAGYVGQGKVGRTPAISIGQLWIGRSSAFTVEAQLIGSEHQGADALFSDILRSIHHKDWKPAEEKTEKEDKEEDASDETKTEESKETQ